MRSEIGARRADARVPGLRVMTGVAVERDVQNLIRPYQGMVAWPSALLGLAVMLSFGLVCTLAVLGHIPLWLGLILNTFVLYVCQTPLHEACHGNIAGRDSNRMWLNHAIGFLCGAILLHEYKAFRALHLMHHRDTNDTEFDPDHWVKVKNPVRVLLRCLTIFVYYNHFFFKHIVFKPDVPGNKKTAMHVIAVYWGLYTIMFWLVMFGHWRELLALWVLPHILASALIVFFFAYVTHQPHDTTERYRDTNVFVVKGPLERVVNWLYCFQNYHLIHHLFPRIPFYLYPQAFDDLRPVLEEKRAPIFEMG